jgi:integration host factor subunit beta
MPSKKSSQLRAETDAASMTKAKLVEHLGQKTKMSVQRAEFVVNAIFACLEQSMRRGERIEIRGFGTFQVRSYKGYAGRNPKTGEAIQVPPKRQPFFKVSKNLAAQVGRSTKSTSRRAESAKRYPAVPR